MESQRTPTTRQLRDFAARVASVTKDGECAVCYQPGDEENPACEDHEAFDMPNDDAVETLHHLIETARELCPVDGLIGNVGQGVPAITKNTLTREVARVMNETGGAAQLALLQVLADLRHVARENNLLFDKAVADSAEVEHEDAASTTEEVLGEQYRLCGLIGEGLTVDWDEVDEAVSDITGLGDSGEVPDQLQLENVAGAVKDLFIRAANFGITSEASGR